MSAQTLRSEILFLSGELLRQEQAAFDPLSVIDQMVVSSYKLSKLDFDCHYFAFARASEYDEGVFKIFLGYKPDTFYRAEHLASLCLLFNWAEATDESGLDLTGQVYAAILRLAANYNGKEVAA